MGIFDDNTLVPYGSGLLSRLLETFPTAVNATFGIGGPNGIDWPRVGQFIKGLDQDPLKTINSYLPPSYKDQSGQVSAPDNPFVTPPVMANVPFPQPRPAVPAPQEVAIPQAAQPAGPAVAPQPAPAAPPPTDIYPQQQRGGLGDAFRGFSANL